jgi:HPt (histidine-containing phosphotransfer) domain-containing protein
MAAPALPVVPGAERMETSQWRAILDALDLPIIVASCAGVVREFNAAAEALTGYRAVEVIGHMRVEHLHDSSEWVARARALSVGLDGRVEPGFGTLLAQARWDAEGIDTWTYVRKDGSRVPVSLSIKAIGEPCSERAEVVIVAHAVEGATGAQGLPAEHGRPSAPANTRHGNTCDEHDPSSATRGECFSPEAVLRRLNGDCRLLDEIVDLFQGEGRAWLEAIDTAVRTGDPGAVARAAHKLRGAALNLGAAAAARAAMDVETCGRAGKVPTAAPLEALAFELGQLSAALQRFRRREVS